MPLTAFQKTTGDELDVSQLLRRFALEGADGQDSSSDQIPESWRTAIREEMECPSCFILGAELVREGYSSQGKKKVVRQACFRFPAHHPQCDFSRSDVAGAAVPDNLVNFGSEKTGLTRLIAQLVGAGIEGEHFNQRTIRDMRRWFFDQKTQSTFKVQLDPRLPVFLKNLVRFTGGYYSASPVQISAEIVSLPGFDWSEAARAELKARNAIYLDAMHSARMHLWSTGDSISHLCSRHMGEIAFDPSPLHDHYTKTISLADFISMHYAPMRRYRTAGSHKSHVPASLAFCALLLYVEEWNLDRAAGLFARIAARATQASGDLGNVMGLNPWHSFEAWRDLRALQNLGLQLPQDLKEPQKELKEIEDSLKAQYARDP